MTTHLGLMAVFSVFVSIVFAALMRDEPRDQLWFGLRLFAGSPEENRRLARR